MKIATIIVLVLLGALFLIASVSYFLNLAPQPELTGNMKTFNEGLNASFYLMPIVKAIELACGIAFISGRFVPLATVLILVATLFLAYRNKAHYRGLLSIK